MAKNNPVLQNLQERYDEMNEYLISLIDDFRRQNEELRYLHAYLSYKNLEEEYYYFKANAHEVYEEDMPFPNLVL